MQQKYFSFHLKIAPKFYYEKDLAWRWDFLKAHSEDYLCKTLILKNKNYDGKI